MNQVKINGKRSWDDWNLVLKNKNIPQPSAKIKMISSGGGDGSLDATPDFVRYENREITITLCSTLGRETWGETRREILGVLNGEKARIEFTEDPGRCYYGRLSIEEIEEDKAFMSISIKVMCDPFVYASEEMTISKELGDINGSASSNGILRFSIADDVEKVEIQAGEKLVYLYGPMEAGEVVFDLAKSYITLNGDSAMPIVGLLSRFDKKGPCEGAQVIKVIADEAEIDWEYRYIPRWY